MNFETKNLIMIGVSTCPSLEDATRIVDELLADKFIACGQIEGPIKSRYEWKDCLREDFEWRITMKFRPENSQLIQKKLLKIHPYETPQWLVWTASATKEYYDWASGEGE